MYSPEIVSSRRKPARKPRKCRRKLIPENGGKDESSVFTQDHDVSCENEGERDLSPEKSEYVPSETDLIESSEEEKLQRRQKTTKNLDAREILAPLNTLNSICSTPTSSKLASCVPSPLFDLNEMSSISLPNINVSDIFNNIENIDPQINQNADTVSISSRQYCSSPSYSFLITANKGLIKYIDNVETNGENKSETVNNKNNTIEEISKQNNQDFFQEQEEVTQEQSQQSNIPKLSDLVCLKIMELMKLPRATGHKTTKCFNLENGISKNRQRLDEENKKAQGQQNKYEKDEEIPENTVSREFLENHAQVSKNDAHETLRPTYSSENQDIVQFNVGTDDQIVSAPVIIVEGHKNAAKVAESNHEGILAPNIIADAKENQEALVPIITVERHENSVIITENNDRVVHVPNVIAEMQENEQVSVPIIIAEGAVNSVNVAENQGTLEPIVIAEYQGNMQNIVGSNLEIIEEVIIEEIEENSQDDAAPQRGRKRKRDEKKWKDNLNKRLKNAGKDYTGARNKKRQEAKTLKDPCDCKRECFNKINNTKRENIHKQFWRIGDHERQWEYILRYISTQNIKTMTLARKNNRSQTIIYKLPCDEDNNTARSVVVCKKMFLNTLGITEKWVYTALEKHEATVVEDLRGKHLNRPRKMRPDTEESVVAHIKSFPVVESHYTRRDSNRLYLNETLNISKMYRLYNEWFVNQTEYENTPLASKSQYESIFNSKFNYGFFKPKKDLCETCFVYESADDERKNQLKEKYDTHINEKKAVRKLKDDEKDDSNNEVKTVACFDLEKVLYIPQSEVSSFYYKRKYAVYNFTIYDVKNHKGYCYLWHQAIAKRGAIEIASCLWHFINAEFESGKRQISFYSDSCAGQNRNRFVFAMYQYASKMLGIDICHRFFEKGHSQSEGDTMHACVERAKKNQTVYTPEQMYYIVSTSKVTGNKFTVKEMTQNDFLNFKDLVTKQSSNPNWLTDDDDQKVFWSRLKEIRVSHADPEKFLFRYSLQENAEVKSISTNKVHSRRRRKIPTQNNEGFTLRTAYQEPIPINALLHKDLMDLCSTGAIPLHYHGFYNNLKAIDGAIHEEDDSENEL